MWDGNEDLKRRALLGAGHGCVALGVAGAFLPLLPSTPFLLLAAACYMHSSERHHRWLLEHRVFGPPLRSYRERRAVPGRTKLLALVLLWSSLAGSAWRLGGFGGRPRIALALALVGAACTAFLLLRVGTLPPEPRG